MIAYLYIVLFFGFLNVNLNMTPIVLWHGMGDNCCGEHSLGYIKSEIEKMIPGVYVYSIRIGSSNFEDTLNGFWYNVNKKIDYVCNKLKGDRLLKNGFNAIGFSQGAQFLRALVQRCESLQMKNLISLGGQHQGVYGIPNCEKGIICNLLIKLINYFVYWNIIQQNSVQASYWHDPFDETNYRASSLFLADINQEKVINLKYKKNLMKLEKFVLVKFEKDEMVHPIESQVRISLNFSQFNYFLFIVVRVL